MNPEQIYQQCCKAAQGLLRGFETRDLSLIEHQVALLRQCLSLRSDKQNQRATGDTLFRLEQLEALDGVTEQMERSLEAMKLSAQTEFERMLGAAALFRHLTRRSAVRGESSLPLC